VISIGVKLSPDDGATKIKTSIGFVKERVKDEITTRADESQQGLFEGGE